MSTRRDFLNLAVKGSAMTAAAGVLPGNPYALLNPDDGRQRISVDSIDIVFVHDLTSDIKLLPTRWKEQFDMPVKGDYHELAHMRKEGLNKGWEIGVNTPEPILRVFNEADPDVCLMA